ncbi:hypothetical protein SAMN05192551_103191 [Tindallia magadiensis]|uniref:Lipoprotein n=1 Tax=Tindallia magadiensis TaxID=69895 RepID=A0A1I3D8F6_9FIRM|nr:hypothetical protein [Tindallia magadiensis]SFH82889.1 hypothetical protein SAMN05192551_103191 [Tindallia magadiensis]
MKPFQKKLIILVVLLLLLPGCGGSSQASSDSEGETATQSQETQEAKDSEKEATSTIESTTLLPAYQSLADEIFAAIETGYQYESFFIPVTRQGNYVMSGDPDADDFITSFTIGIVNDKNYQVIKTEGEITDIHENDMFGAGLDLMGTHIQNLLRQLQAHSSGSPYEENEFHHWDILDVDLQSSGNTTTVTITKELPDSSQDPSVETYTLSDGLLDVYSLTSPYVNQGELQETTYSYQSKGPVDGAFLSSLYEETLAQIP